MFVSKAARQIGLFDRANPVAVTEALPAGAPLTEDPTRSNLKCCLHAVDIQDGGLVCGPVVRRTIMPQNKRPAAKLGRRRDGGGGTPLLREIAYERLKDAIRDGELEPGELLSEARISEAFQISRTPVREALQQLAQEGLVQIQPNRTVTVAALSLQEVLNVLHLRSILEPEIARLVAGSISRANVETLQKCIATMHAAAVEGDRAAWSKADTVLHETLSAVCPNDLLGRLALQMRNRMQLLATDSQTTQARLATCTAEHQAVIDAIAKGDGEEAEAAALAHIRILRESFFKRLGHG